MLHSAVAYNGYIYTVGGSSTISSATTTIFYAPLQASGTVGSWSTAATALPSPLDELSAVVSNGYIYTTGGTSTISVATTTVFYSQINQQGMTAAEGWVTQGAVSTSISLNQAVFSNNYLYSIGGTSDGTNGTTTVSYFSVGSNGTTTGSGNTTALPSASVQHQAFAYTNSGGTTIMYVVGGGTTVSAASTQVAQSTIASNGTLAPGARASPPSFPQTATTLSRELTLIPAMSMS